MEICAVKQRALITLMLILTASIVTFKVAQKQESMSEVYGDLRQLVASQSYYNKLCELDRYTVWVQIKICHVG